MQTGIHAFFVSACTGTAKAGYVIQTEDETTSKRKGSDELDDDSPSEKKMRNSKPSEPRVISKIFVRPTSKRQNEGDSGSDDSTPEKKLRTIVNEDGVIELVAVRKGSIDR